MRCARGSDVQQEKVSESRSASPQAPPLSSSSVVLAPAASRPSWLVVSVLGRLFPVMLVPLMPAALPLMAAPTAPATAAAAAAPTAAALVPLLVRLCAALAGHTLPLLLLKAFLLCLFFGAFLLLATVALLAVILSCCGVCRRSSLRETQ